MNAQALLPPEGTRLAVAGVLAAFAVVSTLSRSSAAVRRRHLNDPALREAARLLRGSSLSDVLVAEGMIRGALCSCPTKVGTRLLRVAHRKRVRITKARAGRRGGRWKGGGGGGGRPARQPPQAGRLTQHQRQRHP